ncbi:XkdX family protein [Lacticaseibacillus saniviri]|nr:XkdX family protein [Lacticaseibacillus saniviri]MCG4280867.1 XkdX family protein [Lacticaseibacillus saniviri]
MWDYFVLEFYKSGIYTKDDLKLNVEVGFITAEQYKTATGEDYE